LKQAIFENRKINCVTVLLAATHECDVTSHASARSVGSFVGLAGGASRSYLQAC